MMDPIRVLIADDEPPARSVRQAAVAWRYAQRPASLDP